MNTKKLLLLVAEAQIGIDNRYYHPNWFIQRLTQLLKREAIQEAKNQPRCENCKKPRYFYSAKIPGCVSWLSRT